MAASYSGSKENTSTFPEPPAIYIKQVNDELAAGIVPKPPKPPSDGEVYQMFGVKYAENAPLIPTLLDSTGTPVKFSKTESKKAQMKEFNMNLLYNFLDLIEKLQNMEPTQSILQEIEMEFVKLQHLINESQPFKHREILINMLRGQKVSTLTAIETLNEKMKRTVLIITKKTRFRKNLDHTALMEEDGLGKVCLQGSDCSFCAAESQKMSEVPTNLVAEDPVNKIF